MVRQVIPSVATPLAAPDWTAPWYQPWAGVGRAVWQAAAAQGSCAGAVAAALDAQAPAPLPVRFVPADQLPAGAAYEAFIASQRAVPTRDNGHDAFNGLVWLRLPHTKARLNALQAAAIARDGVQATRGALRDAATVFDENAVLLHAPDALWQALAARRWSELFGPLRPLWREARLLVFGHAALEKLVAPYKSITGHVWRVGLPFDPLGDLQALDAWLAADLTPDKLAAKPFAPLPLLGVPGWWAGNEEAGFYDDAQVFRPARGGTDAPLALTPTLSQGERESC
ncbi:MAG: DUF3025 domain-containing protein [Burkholderiaceae bacterium]